MLKAGADPVKGIHHLIIACGDNPVSVNGSAGTRSVRSPVFFLEFHDPEKIRSLCFCAVLGNIQADIFVLGRDPEREISVYCPDNEIRYEKRHNKSCNNSGHLHH